MLPKQPNQSLIDGLECISSLASAGRVLGARELARELGLEPTRVHRLLKTLSHIGVCAQDSKGKYYPGPGIYLLAAQSLYASPLLKKALCLIPKLRKFKMISAIGVLWRDKVSYLYHNEPSISFEKSIGRVSVYPASKSAIGMVLLSEKTDDEIKKIYSGKKIDGYENRISKLLEHICEIRKAKWALVQQENGFKSFAVPVGNPALFGIALSGKIKKNEEKKILSALFDISEKIQKVT